MRRLCGIHHCDKYPSSLDDYIQVLEKEVNIDFCRSMNRIIFDKTIQDDPMTFAFVSVPEEAPEEVPDKGVHILYSVDTSLYI